MDYTCTDQQFTHEGLGIVIIVGTEILYKYDIQECISLESVFWMTGFSLVLSFHCMYKPLLSDILTSLRESLNSTVHVLVLYVYIWLI